MVVTLAEDPCFLCRKYTAYYTKEEQQVYKQFAPYSLICKLCFPSVKLFIENGSSHQEQRKQCLFGLTNYFGVLDRDSAFNLFKGNRSATGGRFFVWERQIPHPVRMDQLVMIVAVTFTQTNEFMRLPQSYILDKHTTYIVRCPDSAYYSAHGTYWFSGKQHEEFECLLERKKLKFAGNTLQKALDEVHLSHGLMDHNNISAECLCEPVSKYIPPLRAPIKRGGVKSLHRYNPWSLKQLAAFSIRNFYFHSHPKMFHTLPKKITDQIVTSVQV